VTVGVDGQDIVEMVPVVAEAVFDNADVPPIFDAVIS
jgi:hypothetical protein